MKIPNKKILFFDLETTGVDFNQHEIIQFAAIIEIAGKIKETISLKCRPRKWNMISKKALEITGETIEELKTYPPAENMVCDIIHSFDKYIDKFDSSDKFYPCGHNVQFDLNFLNKLFMDNGQKFGSGCYQNWRSLDTRVMANLLAFHDKIDVPDIKLETLCNYFGIEIKAHNALSDILATRKLFYKLKDIN